MLSGHTDGEKFDRLIEALQAQTAAILATQGKPTTLEPRAPKVKE
jgi:hypothetical protein